MRRLILAGVVASTGLIALAYASAFSPDGARWGLWCMIAGVTGNAVGIMALGVYREDRRQRVVGIALLLVATSVVTALSLALLLPDRGVDEPLVLGLPQRAAAVIYLAGVAPLLILPLVYAWTFDQVTLSDDDLRALRATRTTPTDDA
jgi:hypothetical protein